jgi:hypothetical protein
VTSTPKAPDPMKTAQAQSGLNTDTALTQQLTNMINQTNPWGSVNYDQNGTTGFIDSTGKYRTIPQFTQTTTYNPEQQAIFDASTQAQTNLANIASEQSASIQKYLNDRFQFSGGPDVQGLANNAVKAPGALQAQHINAPDALQAQQFSFDNQDAANWATDLASQRILPQQKQDRTALETQLVNRGLRPGTAAWNSELERQGRTQNDQINQLTLNGRQQAYGEASNTFGANQQSALNAYDRNWASQLGANQANFANDLGAYGANWNAALGANQNQFNQANTARNQAFQEAVTQRNQPLNEISALMSGSQIANPGQQSSATPQAQVAGVDYSGLVNSNYQSQLASSGGMMGGLFGLAGTLGGAAIKSGAFSDERLKTYIQKVGTLDNGLSVYSYRYVWGGPAQIGVMAHEVADVRPEAVHMHDSGYLMVDYEKAVG